MCITSRSSVPLMRTFHTAIVIAIAMEIYYWAWQHLYLNPATLWKRKPEEGVDNIMHPAP